MLKYICPAALSCFSVKDVYNCDQAPADEAACDAALLHLRLPWTGGDRGMLDQGAKDVKPPGATAPYVSPEVLRSLKLQFEGANDDEDGVLVNGGVADMWSFACILYEMLTGEKPFLPTKIPTKTPPECVPPGLQDQWLVYDAYAEAQSDWVSGCIVVWHQ